MIIKMAKPLDPDARRVALALLAQGLVRPHEVAQMAGVSLQVVNYWCTAAGVDWERMRRRRYAALWRKRMRRGPKTVET